MTIFYLPDLGEGLAEAEIYEWHVKVGDVVKLDQPLVSMETAKAVVDVPSPQAGKILKLYGDKSTIIKTHAPLMEFEEQESADSSKKPDAGTVVGSLEVSNNILKEPTMVIGASTGSTNAIKVMPAVRELAKELNVDLSQVKPTGPQGQIKREDVLNNIPTRDLHGVRRAMAEAMKKSHAEVVPVTLTEDANLSVLSPAIDITVLLIKSMVTACQAVPILNSWYDSQKNHFISHKHINMGLAMDTEEGLFVPVLQKVETLSPDNLRDHINKIKTLIRTRQLAANDFAEATITLSNFGMIAGCYATPIVIPPTVAIIGAGRCRDRAAIISNKLISQRILPLSLTFDHRLVTGGEASRFLAAMIATIEVGLV